MIAGYDGEPLPLAYPALILVNRLKVEGFIVSEHMEVWPEALAELGMLVGSGKLRPRESVAQGLESAPEAFIGLLKGKNFGKHFPPKGRRRCSGARRTPRWSSGG
jgi:NADPH-dependent curcumin reductase CurA